MVVNGDRGTGQTEYRQNRPRRDLAVRASQVASLLELRQSPSYRYDRKSRSAAQAMPTADAPLCPGFKSEIAKSAVSRVHGDTSTTQRLLIALMTELAQRIMWWTGDLRNPFVPKLSEIVYRLKCRGQVINVYR